MGSSLEEFFFENFLSTYCNYVINMDHSLGHRYYDRSYVGLGFFFLKGNPLFYEGIVL